MRSRLRCEGIESLESRLMLAANAVDSPTSNTALDIADGVAAEVAPGEAERQRHENGSRRTRAHGAGTYFVGPGIRTELQFNATQVQCKIGHSVLPDGTIFQMFMRSTSVDSMEIDSEAGSVVITGSMVSTVNLTSTDGSTAQLTETVPYIATAVDNGNPGKGGDTFSLTVAYVDTTGLDQFDLFGSPATFAGTLKTGNVVVR